jgi:hypothetical protein
MKNWDWCKIVCCEEHFVDGPIFRLVGSPIAGKTIPTNHQQVDQTLQL